MKLNKILPVAVLLIAMNCFAQIRLPKLKQKMGFITLQTLLIIL